MKILTFSFDDGEIYDRALCALLRRYQMKATFYLISDQLGQRVPFHRYGRDTVVERTSATELPQTYQGMEIASHTRHHRLGTERLEADVALSLRELSAAWGQPVRGLAYPGGQYTGAQVAALKKTGVRYARSASTTYTFDIPVDWYTWQPTCHYADAALPDLIRRFLSAPGEQDLLFHIFCHSYELSRPDPQWDFAHMEGLLQSLADAKDIMPATNGMTWKLFHKTDKGEPR